MSAPEACVEVPGERLQWPKSKLEQSVADNTKNFGVAQGPILPSCAEFSKISDGLQCKYNHIAMTRNSALDFLKLAMAFMVVGLHSRFLQETSPLYSFITVNGIFRIAVPVFLLINGYYFQYALNAGRFTQWLRRLVALYVVWMTAYTYFWLPPLGISGAIKAVLILIMGYWHLWYVVGILCSALLLILARRLSTPSLLALSCTLFAIGVLIQYATVYTSFPGDGLLPKPRTIYLHRNFLFFSFPFFCLGYLISKHQWHSKISVPHTFLLLAAGITLLLFESLANFTGAHAPKSFDNYASLAVVCPALFIATLKSKMEFDSSHVSLYANGIYFSHAMFILILTNELGVAEGTRLALLSLVCSLAFCFVVLKSKSATRLLF